MSVLLGRGSLSGAMPVLATAALLGDASGRYTLSDSILALAARRVRRGDGPLDTVLVANDAAHALLLRLPSEFSLVGVIAEQSLAFVPPADGIALVSGVAEALSEIRDGDWVIVDPTRGRIVVSPQAEEIARLQNARYLRPSVLLGAAHTPARTLTGRTVAVWAQVSTLEEVQSALANGADGILIGEDSQLLAVGGEGEEGEDTEQDTDEAMFGLLRQAADAMGGGEVCIAAGVEAIHPRTIVALAALCRLSWAMRPDSLPFSIAELFGEMNDLIDAEEDEGRRAALPRLAAVVSEAPEGSGADDPSLVDFDEALWTAETLPNFAGFLPPVLRVVLAKPEDQNVMETVLSLGATGIVVAASQIERAKDSIRQVES
ncbi:MAG: hypothetical protein H7Z41_12240 [Cytophagales bacterium]|nr:hypothetical protein [Armatimonadota bacterium]